MCCCAHTQNCHTFCSKIKRVAVVSQVLRIREYIPVFAHILLVCVTIRSREKKEEVALVLFYFILLTVLLLHKRIIKLSFIVSLASNEVTKTTINTTFAISGADKISRQQCGRWWSSQIILSPKD